MPAISRRAGAALLERPFVYHGQSIVLALQNGQLVHRDLYGPTVDMVLADKEVGAGGG